MMSERRTTEGHWNV